MKIVRRWGNFIFIPYDQYTFTYCNKNWSPSHSSYHFCFLSFDFIRCTRLSRYVSSGTLMCLRRFRYIHLPTGPFRFWIYMSRSPFQTLIFYWFCNLFILITYRLFLLFVIVRKIIKTSKTTININKSKPWPFTKNFSFSVRFFKVYLDSTL